MVVIDAGKSRYDNCARLFAAGWSVSQVVANTEFSESSVNRLYKAWNDRMAKRIPAAQPQPKKSHARRTSPRKGSSSARGGSGKGGRQRLPAPASMLFEFGSERDLRMISAPDGHHVKTEQPVKVTLQSGISFYISPEKLKKD